MLLSFFVTRCRWGRFSATTFPAPRAEACASVGDLVFHRFLSRAVSAQLRGLGRFRLCGTRPRASLRRSALRRASETDYAQKPETQTIPADALRLYPRGGICLSCVLEHIKKQCYSEVKNNSFD